MYLWIRAFFIRKIFIRKWGSKTQKPLKNVKKISSLSTTVRPVKVTIQLSLINSRLDIRELGYDTGI